MSKKTVLYSDVDGYQVVKLFGDAQVDPVATLAKIEDAVLGLDELARVKSARAKIQAQAEAAQTAAALARAAAKAGNTRSAETYENQYLAAKAQAAVLEDELTAVVADYEAARDALFEKNAAYFTPGPGEMMLGDADYADLKAKAAALKEGEVVTVDGRVVVDNRGKVYWTKGEAWAAKTITALGETIPAGAIAEADLTEAQRDEIAAEFEAARVAGLTAEDKAAELAQELEAAAREAVQKRGMAEVTGDEFDARVWYAERKAELELKYAAA